MSMNDYEMVVGLEVHAELNTKTKIFCGCKNSFGAAVNTQVCPVCMGFPGTLPVLNGAVVDYAIKMGHALGCTINNLCKQDRKNYFYPDLPKAYQISQFDIPLCSDGKLDILVDGKPVTIGVTRIHIEEDAGKLIHLDKAGGTLVDMNRCGVPLIEIVSEPDFRSTAQVKAYLDTIKLILQYLDISDCKMQEGSIRCDVNVSARKKGDTAFGTRTEMKNVNTFSGAVRAIEYEFARQVEILEAGGSISQETLRWDDQQGRNFPLRSKEDAHDYRYFREPDLPPIVVSPEHVQELKDSLPELPNVKAIRFVGEYGLPMYDAQLLCEARTKAEFFERCVGLCSATPKTVSNWVLGDVTKVLNERNCDIADLKLTPENLAEMIDLIEAGTISVTAGKTVLETIVDEDVKPSALVEKLGLKQVSDTAELEGIVSEVLKGNPKAVEDYKKGKTNVTGFLVGQCMRATKGKANPGVLGELVKKLLEQQ